MDQSFFQRLTTPESFFNFFLVFPCWRRDRCPLAVGSAMQSPAIEALVSRISILESCEIFSSALASANGLLVRWEPVASARNSRSLLIASLVSVPINTPTVKNKIPIRISGPELFLFPPPLTLIKISPIISMAPTSVIARSITLMSLFRMCPISCAMTPSSSLLSSVSRRPFEIATFEFFGLVPVANALRLISLMM